MLYCSDVKLRQRLISLGCGQLSVGREAARAWCNRPCCSTTTLRAVGIVSQPAGVAPVCFGRRRHVGAHRRSVCARHDAPPILHRLGQRVVGALHHGQPVVHVVAPARLVRHLQNNSRSSPLVKYTQRLASGVQTRDRLSLPPSRRFQQGLNISFNATGISIGSLQFVGDFTSSHTVGAHPPNSSDAGVCHQGTRPVTTPHPSKSEPDGFRLLAAPVEGSRPSPPQRP
jgi:hypothetical protein